MSQQTITLSQRWRQHLMPTFAHIVRLFPVTTRKRKKTQVTTTCRVIVTNEEPTGAERWEIRTRPLGCQVSTITSLTSLVTIALTIVFVGMVAGLGLYIRRACRHRQQQEAGWWSRWEHGCLSRDSSWFLPYSSRDVGHAEDEPLLREQRSSSNRSHGDDAGASDYAHEDAQTRSRKVAWSPQISPKTSPVRQPELTGGMRATSSNSRRTISSSSSS